MLKYFFLLTLLCLTACAAPLPQTRAERTGFTETSRYDDIQSFYHDLHSPLMHVTTFGKTLEGRPIPLIIFADPPLQDARAAALSHKPVLLVQANIHAGEVEGKEALMILSRRITHGDLRPLLKNLILLFIPDYNADGNEKIALENRTAQYGPITGVGIRENAQGLDLNRDYIKLDAPESNALVRLYTAWDPLLTVDLHTTDGSYHGYHLTYSVPLNPSSDPGLLAYHRQQLMPAIAAAMLQKYGYRTQYYGNFTPSYADGRRPPRTPAAATTTTGPATRPTAWYAFSAAPRVGQNYLGLRNRMTILSEAYSYLDFKSRVDVTEAFVEEILRYTAAHAADMRHTCDLADAATLRRARDGTLQIGLAYEPKASAGGISEILMADVLKIPNPLSKLDMTAAQMDKLTPLQVFNYDDFAATRWAAAPRAYLFRDEPGLQVLADKLRAHGIRVETLSAPLDAQVDAFTIASATPSPTTFQNHREMTLTGAFQKQTLSFPAGTRLVRTDQPLGRLAAYLLEPESDDGLTRWNFLDPYLAPNKTHPIYKLPTPLPTPTHPLGDEAE